MIDQANLIYCSFVYSLSHIENLLLIVMKLYFHNGKYETLLQNKKKQKEIGQMNLRISNKLATNRKLYFQENKRKRLLHFDR